MKNLPSIRGILLDLEGVLYVGDQLIDGHYSAPPCLTEVD